MEVFKVGIPLEMIMQAGLTAQKAEKKLTAFEKSVRRTEQQMKRISATTYELKIGARNEAGAMVKAILAKVNKMSIEIPLKILGINKIEQMVSDLNNMEPTCFKITVDWATDVGTSFEEWWGSYGSVIGKKIGEGISNEIQTALNNEKLNLNINLQNSEPAWAQVLNYGSQVAGIISGLGTLAVGGSKGIGYVKRKWGAKNTATPSPVLETIDQSPVKGIPHYKNESGVFVQPGSDFRTEAKLVLPSGEIKNIPKSPSGDITPKGSKLTPPPSGIAANMFQPTKAASGLKSLAKGASKMAGKLFRPLGLVTDIVNIASAPPGEARSQAIGSAAGGAIGAALGSVIPGVGTIIGGFAGDAIGGWLGKMLGSKGSKKTDESMAIQQAEEMEFANQGYMRTVSDITSNQEDLGEATQSLESYQLRLLESTVALSEAMDDITSKVNGGDTVQIHSGNSSNMGEPFELMDEDVRFLASGGILTKPHLGLVAEDGPEGIIPLSRGKRSRGIGLWQQVGKILGVSPYGEGGLIGQIPIGVPKSVAAKDQAGVSTVTVHVNASPTFTVHSSGDGESVAATIRTQIRSMANDLGDEIAERMLKVYGNMPVSQGGY